MATESRFEVHYTPYRLGEDNHTFSLPHQCDEWTIGGVEDMRQFIAECQAALDAVESGNVDKHGIYPRDYWDEEDWDY